MDELVDKTLIDYFTGKKFFFPVFVKSLGRDKLFKPSKRSLDMKVFLSEEDAVHWCKEEGLTPVGIVQYDILCTPKRVITTQEINRINKQEELRIKQETPKPTIKKRKKRMPKVKSKTTPVAQKAAVVTNIKPKTTTRITKNTAAGIEPVFTKKYTRVTPAKKTDKATVVVPVKAVKHLTIGKKKATVSHQPRVRRTKAEIAAGISLQAKIADKKNS